MTQTKDTLNFGDFHDASWCGIHFIDSRSTLLSFRTTNGQKSWILIEGVVSLNATGLREGNIVFAFELYSDNVQNEELREILGISEYDSSDYMEKIRRRIASSELLVVRISNSVGGDLCAICSNVRRLSDDQIWALLSEGEPKRI